MKKLFKDFNFLFFLTLFLSCCLPIKAYGQQQAAIDYKTPQILHKVSAKLAGKPISLMLARTNAQRAKGLMFYNEIAKNVGMFFIYAYSHRMSFWMKNTKIPLDLVFFSEDLKITEWIKNMAPGYGKKDSDLPHYKSRFLARYALELKAGSIEELGLKIGDRLEIPIMFLYSE